MKLSSTAGISSIAPPSPPPASSSASPPASSQTISLAAPKKAPSVPATPSSAARAAAPREVVIERQSKPKGDGGGKNSGAPKKRVRLKPETPEQLIERLRNPQLSLHEASILLRVSRATVRRYADAGRLSCQRTPGGQRRFFLRDIENFYRQLKLKR